MTFLRPFANSRTFDSVRRALLVTATVTHSHTHSRVSNRWLARPPWTTRSVNRSWPRNSLSRGNCDKNSLISLRSLFHSLALTPPQKKKEYLHVPEKRQKGGQKNRSTGSSRAFYPQEDLGRRPFGTAGQKRLPPRWVRFFLARPKTPESSSFLHARLLSLFFLPAEKIPHGARKKHVYNTSE